VIRSEDNRGFPSAADLMRAEREYWKNQTAHAEASARAAEKSARVWSWVAGLGWALLVVSLLPK